MATIYNKTALKKVKKDELIQMFLDLQAQRINDSMDEAVEKCCNNAIEEVVEGLKKQNEILEEENEKLKKVVLKSSTEKNSQLWRGRCKKLKKEMSQLEMKLIHQTPLGLHNANVKMNREIEQYKEEIQKLKAQINQN